MMNTKNWKKFRMSEIFVLFERGKVHSQNILPMGNDCFYVGAKKKQCGVMCRCGYDEELNSKGNCMIFICNGEGSVGYCNYMDRNFMASGDLILAYGDFLNTYTAMFIETLLDLERPKYSFGRKYGKHVKNTFIPLPIDDNETPDWQWIENYVKEMLIPKLPQKAKAVWEKRYDTKPLFPNKLKLNTKEWQWFVVGNVFDCSTTKHAIQQDLSEGDTPFVTRSAENNGVSAYIDATNCVINDPNCITIGAEGVFAFYQPKAFVTGVKVYTLRHERLNKYNALFISTLLNKENYRYNYGNARILDKIKKEQIKLPVDTNGNPDWQWMEDYIKSLPYSACL